MLLCCLGALAGGARAEPPADADAAPPKGHSALVVEADSGAVLVDEAATHPWYPASLTKLMTAYLTLAAVEAGELALGQTLTASAAVAAQPETALGLTEGEALSVEQALRALVVRSANDAAVLLAEAVAGSEGAFAERMTAQARALGMRATQFRNASGLPDAGQVTTARDMALLARALVHDFPDHYALFSARSFRWRGQDLPGLNAILAYPGADGLKTGFTCGSGYNLVASAVRDGRRLIGVVMGAESGARRTAIMTRLLDRGFATPASDRNLDALAARADAPPFRLGPGECAIGASRRPAGRLPGWGVLLGVFDDPKAAEAAARRTQRSAAKFFPGGETAVQRQEMVEPPRYRALVVGLEQQQATRACLGLRTLGVTCLVQSPQRLNPGQPPPPPKP